MPNCELKPNPCELKFPDEDFRETDIHNGYRVSVRLEERLLQLGGDAVVPVPEPDLDIILSRGREFPTAGLKKTWGYANGCHRCAALHYAKWPGKAEIICGYYLIEGLWRSHTFLWTGKHIIETTSIAERYFGAILEPAEASLFVFGHVIGQLPGFNKNLDGSEGAGPRSPVGAIPMDAIIWPH